MKRPSKTFEIALSAIACAVAASALTLGWYVNVLLAAGYLIAVYALMVPLSKNFYWGEALAYLGALLLAFLFCGFTFVRLVPFAVFFGLHPLVNHIEKRFVKKMWLHLPIFLGKAAWFDLSMWLAWVLLVPILGLEHATWYPFVSEYFAVVLLAGGTAFFAAYDYMIFLCQRSVDFAVRRIRR